MHEHYFTPEVCQAIGNYVYRLIDPRNGETFYVGKGKGNRVFDHAKALLKFDAGTEEMDPKLNRIQDIINERLEVLHIIHRHEIPESAVFEVEAALIDAYAGLTNLQAGHGSNDRGPMNYKELIRKYDLPVLDDDIQEKLVLININNSCNRVDSDAIYRQVRFAWRISKNRAEKAEYILAVIRGVIVGAFVAHEWLPASRDYFPEFSELVGDNTEGRYGFIGQKAPIEVWGKFVGEMGKRIQNKSMKHDQNPIRYWNI